MKNIKVNPLFFVILAFVYMTKNLQYFTITFLTLTIHELVHLYFMCQDKIITEKITVEPFGISISANTRGITSIWVYLSAPIFNLSLATVFYYLIKNYGLFYLSPLVFTNFVVGSLNILPILPFDGGRAFNLILKKKYNQSPKFLINASFFFGILMFVLGLYIITISNFNFSLLIIGVFIIYNSICEKELLFKERQIDSSKRYQMQDIQKKMNTITISVPYNYKAYKLLKEFSGECYYIVNVIKNGVLLKTLTETQIISTLSRENENICVGEM